MMNFIGTQPIESPRLLLRRFTRDDVESVLKNWAADPLVQHEYGEPTYISPRQVTDLLDVYIASYRNDAYRWAIILPETKECIGQIAFFLVDEKNRFCEMEYCIGRTFQRNGYATEATRAVIRFGFEKVGFHRIQICRRVSNIASKGVIENCGFLYEGTLRDYFYRDGKYESRMYFSILEEEYRARPWDWS